MDMLKYDYDADTDTSHFAFYLSDNHSIFIIFFLDQTKHLLHWT